MADIIAAATGGVSHTFPDDVGRPVAATPTAVEITDVHRDILFGLGRDSTCPPPRISDSSEFPALASALVEPAMSDVLAVFGDPDSLHLLSAWRQAGVDRAHLIGVVRTPAEATLCLEQRDGLRFAHAGELVDLALERLRLVAIDQPLPVIRFAHDVDVAGAVVDVVRGWGIDADLSAAQAAFRPELITRRAPVGSATPAFDGAIAAAATASPGPQPVPKTPPVDEYGSLPKHCGERFQRRRSSLCEAFEIDQRAVVAEVVPSGARPMTAERVLGAHAVVVDIAGSTGLDRALAGLLRRPDVIIAPGLLDEVASEEISHLLDIAATTSFPVCDLIVDVWGEPPSQLTTDQRWRMIETCPLPEGRVAVRLSKVPRSEIEIIGEETRRLERLVDRMIDTWAGESSTHVDQAWSGMSPAELGLELRRERGRALRAEERFERLRQRRSVRAALALTDALSPIVRWSTRATGRRRRT